MEDKAQTTCKPDPYLSWLPGGSPHRVCQRFQVSKLPEVSLKWKSLLITILPYHEGRPVAKRDQMHPRPGVWTKFALLYEEPAVFDPRKTLENQFLRGNYPIL